MTILSIFWWLLVTHAVCDYPLQGDFLARGKSHKTPLSGIPWWQCLLAHALIQGGGVALVTGSVIMGCAEVIVHCMIDYGKCDGQYGFNADQFLHFLCKVSWVGAWLFVK